jgi:hypothetical protein
MPASISPDEAARNASLAASDRLSQWAVDAALRTDVYEALKARFGVRFVRCSRSV